MTELNHSNETTLTPQPIEVRGGFLGVFRLGSAARKAWRLLPGPFVGSELDPDSHRPLVQFKVTNETPTTREIEMHELSKGGDAQLHSFIAFSEDDTVSGYSRNYTELRTGRGSATELAAEPEPSALSVHDVSRVVKIAQEAQQHGAERS